MWNYKNPPTSDELYHYGTKGQRWGERKYQYEDGSLTPAGRERYYDSSSRPKGREKNATGTGKAVSKKGSGLSSNGKDKNSLDVKSFPFTSNEAKITSLLKEYGYVDSNGDVRFKNSDDIDEYLYRVSEMDESEKRKRQNSAWQDADNNPSDKELDAAETAKRKRQNSAWQDSKEMNDRNRKSAAWNEAKESLMNSVASSTPSSVTKKVSGMKKVSVVSVANTTLNVLTDVYISLFKKK